MSRRTLAIGFALGLLIGLTGPTAYDVGRDFQDRISESIWPNQVKNNQAGTLICHCGKGWAWGDRTGALNAGSSFVNHKRSGACK